MDRIFSYLNCAKEGKIKATRDEVKAQLQAEGFISEKHGIRMFYRRKNELTAADIETMVHEIESEGEYEVKLVVHDYLKRLRPNLPSGDIRIDLGECANDLSELSKLLKVPIVTANQLNREAYKVLLQSGVNENKNDLGKNASLTMQSESQLITENADSVLAINKEFLRATGEWFLTFTDLKNRASKTNKTSNNRYFAVPFEPDNSMRLQEDEGTDDDFGVDSISDKLEKYIPEGDASDPDDLDKGSVSTRRTRGVRQANLDEELD